MEIKNIDWFTRIRIKVNPWALLIIVFASHWIGIGYANIIWHLSPEKTIGLYLSIALVIMGFLTLVVWAIIIFTETKHGFYMD